MKRKNTIAKTINVGIISLGCPKNTVDSEAMLGRLAHCGYRIVGDLELADVVIVNTCGFIEPAKQEAIEQLRDVAKYKDAGKVKRIIAAGCLAQRMGKELIDEVPQIDALVALADRDNIENIISGLFKKNTTPEPTANIDNNFISNDQGRLLTTGGHFAYLRISEGCDRNCSFCTIPSIRGRFRSKPIKNIAREAEELAKSGVKELILIAQDSSYYGKDLGLTDGLAELLEVLESFSFKWIRIMYLYPATVTDKLIEKIASSEKVLSYIDMPIQHINDEILKSMRRSDSKEKTTSLINKLRSKIPNVTLRTTVITGYPGEAQQQHNELLEFIKWAKFDALGCFAYVAEEGTPAAALDKQIPDEVKSQRLDDIMLTQQQIVFDKNEELIGKEFDMLIDAVLPDGTAQGRCYRQAPDIDSLCILENSTRKHLKTGSFLTVKVTDYDGYDLIVRQNRKN